MINHECCVCYSTTEDIEPSLKNSFITIPCGGGHIVCFSCFMRNASAKCPMCRFNYKTMKPADAEPDNLPIMPIEELIDYPFEPNEDIAFVDNWWLQLNHRIPEMLPVIQREVFQTMRNLPNMNGGLTIDFEWVSDAIEQNRYRENNIIDMEDDYDMCCRMYLTRMLVAFNEIEGENYADLITAVNDFIQHEYDTGL